MRRQQLRSVLFLYILKVFDGAIRATTEIVDMPDRRASLLVRLILQNNGRLSQTKRSSFPELKDEEISAIEEAVVRNQTT